MLKNFVRVFVLAAFFVTAVQMPTVSADRGYFTLVNRSGETLHLLEVINDDVTVYNCYFSLDNGEELEVDVSSYIGNAEYYDVMIGCGNGMNLHFRQVNIAEISRIVVNSNGTAQFD